MRRGTSSFRSSLLWFAVLLTFISASGASCNRQWLRPFSTPGPVAPQVLGEGAQTAQIAAAVNQNTARVHSLSAPNTTITIPHSSLIPPLRGNITMQRPRRIRLTASTALTGSELDLGSNDELFWLWVRRNQPPGVYMCRHDQFAGSAAHQIMPIEPWWLQSALGIVELDPSTVYEGPTPRGDGTFELRTTMPSARGNLNRVLVVDNTASVLEQHVYDTNGTTLLASAVVKKHRYYPFQQVSLPEQVEIQLPPVQLAFTVDVGEVQINQLPANAAQLWELPTFEGYQQYDLGTLPAGSALPSSSPLSPPAQPQPPWNTAPLNTQAKATPQIPSSSQVAPPVAAQPSGYVRRAPWQTWHESPVRRDPAVQPSVYEVKSPASQ